MAEKTEEPNPETEEEPEPDPVELSPPVEVIVQRWPVLRRETDEDGRMKRNSYVRTKEPLESRTLTVDRFLTSTRAEVYFGIGGCRSFSVRTGRCIGLADWVLEKKSLTELRKLAKTLFPKAKKKRATAKSTEDNGDDLPDFSGTPPANEVT